MKIINLTRLPATPGQIAAGVVNLEGNSLDILMSLTAFEEPPSKDFMRAAAGVLASIAAALEAEAAMVHVAPFFISTLEEALKEYGIKPLYALTRLETIEEIQDDDTVKKVSLPMHAGFVEV
jgi:hypothetical protein